MFIFPGYWLFHLLIFEEKKTFSLSHGAIIAEIEKKILFFLFEKINFVQIFQNPL